MPQTSPDDDARRPLHVEEWTESDGRPLRTLVSGRPRTGAPEVVLVPGLGAVGYMLELLHACGAWTRATLVDLPGFGQQRTADLPSDLDSVTARLLSALPPSPSVLVGHSTGTQVAMHAALDAPDRVGALVLVGPTFEPAARRPGALLARHMWTSAFEPPGQLRYTVPDYLRGGRRFREYLTSALRDRPEEQIGRIQAPVIAARGRHDHFASQEWVQQLAAAAPRGRARTLPGAHAVPYNHPGAVAQLAGEAAAAMGGS
ncbi:alpha/beta fold hydrolase [Blastococcus deserti]|uniref:Alpha/beta fold hydrolase n=1 Tax=Blastococcus deserti TaxID=2259033 RepID=A0ABW4XC90_9ACTN